MNYYSQTYHFVPIWVLVDYLDFGDLSTLIDVVPRNLQNKIANDLTSFIIDNNPDFNDKFDPKVMTSFIKNIHETRNICAHNNRLVYFRCRSDSKFFEYLHTKYNFIPDDDRSTVYSTFISLQCFISQTEYAKLNNTIRKRTQTLDNHLASIGINSILKLLGFPDNWHLRPKIEQSE
ncbi:Abi family protein [Limosilactobacillus sp.]|uniref:Abi family protein n=1 Tax=Limosilactobacillus sp. TaxID=2773925 RepID=UPI0025C5913B|nr:Abi family protein [Limosilactobacillus sp.]